MALSNNTELKAAIADWLNRSDLTTQIVDFITLTESRIAAELKTNDTHVTTTLAVDAQSEDLPADFSGMVRLTFGDYYPTLTYLPPDEFWTRYLSNYNGKPAAYTIEANKIYFGPTPDQAMTLNYTYIAKPDIATDSTNRVLTMYPGLYLFGALSEAYSFLGDTESQMVAESKYQQALAMANASDQFKGPLNMIIPGIV